MSWIYWLIYPVVLIFLIASIELFHDGDAWSGVVGLWITSLIFVPTFLLHRKSLRKKKEERLRAMQEAADEAERDTVSQMPGYKLFRTLTDVRIRNEYFTTRDLVRGQEALLKEELYNPHDTRTIGVYCLGTKRGTLPPSVQSLYEELVSLGGAVLGRIAFVSDEYLGVDLWFYEREDSEYWRLQKKGVTFRTYEVQLEATEEAFLVMTNLHIGESLRIEPAPSQNPKKYFPEEDTAESFFVMARGVTVGRITPAEGETLDTDRKVYILEIRLSPGQTLTVAYPES